MKNKKVGNKTGKTLWESIFGDRCTARVLIFLCVLGMCKYCSNVEYFRGWLRCLKWKGWGGELER